MSLTKTGKCADCPLTLAVQDPTWRFDEAGCGHRIREATLADKDAIGEYILAMTDEMRRNRYHYSVRAEAAFAERTKEHEQHPPDGRSHIEYVVVAPCGAILGVCHAYDQDEYHAIGISVSVELAGRGFASRILQAVEDHARRIKTVRALLAVTENGNAPMIELAKRHGFRPLGHGERIHHNIEQGESPWLLEL